MPCPTQSSPAAPSAVTRPDSAGAPSATPVSTTATVVPAPWESGRARAIPKDPSVQGSALAFSPETEAQVSSSARTERTTGSPTESAAAGTAPTAPSAVAVVNRVAATAEARGRRRGRTRARDMARMIGGASDGASSGP